MKRPLAGPHPFAVGSGELFCGSRGRRFKSGYTDLDGVLTELAHHPQGRLISQRSPEADRAAALAAIRTARR
jgi:YD repeat-containing protein